MSKIGKLLKGMVIGIGLGMLGFAGYILIGEGTGAITYPCVEKAEVVDILRVNYRSATLLLDNGSEYVVNQATVKDGDTICLRSEQQINW